MLNKQAKFSLTPKFSLDYHTKKKWAEKSEIPKKPNSSFKLPYQSIFLYVHPTITAALYGAAIKDGLQANHVLNEHTTRVI